MKLLRFLPILTAGILGTLGAKTAAHTVSSVAANYVAPGYVIANDPTLNRDEISATASVTITTAGSFRLHWSLLDPADNVMATDTSPVGSFSPGSYTPTGNLPTSAAARLEPGVLYRVQLELIEIVGGTPGVVASDVEPVGNTYLHFITPASTDDARNIIGVVDSVVINRNWLNDHNPLRRTIPATVNFTLHRFDNIDVGAFGEPGIPVRFSAELKNGGSTMAGTSLPAATTVGMATYAVSGPDYLPATASGSISIEFDPSVVLQPDFHDLVVTIEHEEDSATATFQPGAAGQDDERISHFTGELRFGSIVGRFITSTSVTDDSPLGFTPGLSINKVIRPSLNSGTIDGRMDHHFGDGSPLNVTLSNGIATVTGGAATLTPDSPELARDMVNGVEFERVGTVKLDASGASAPLSARLPIGVGWRDQPHYGLLADGVSFATRFLNQALAPLDSALTQAFPAGTFYLCEETKPLLFECTVLTWDVPGGEFQTGTTADGHSIRKPLLQHLLSLASLLRESDMQLKRSNDHVYNQITTIQNGALKKGVSGGGELTGTLNVNAHAFVTHFPYNTIVWWNAASTIGVADDLIDPANTNLNSPLNLISQYALHCYDAAANCGLAATFRTPTVTPSGSLKMTTDGGLHSTGTVAMSPLAWGLLDATSGDTVQTLAASFPTANFLMAGTFLRGDQNPLGDENGPGMILLSGFDPSDLTVAERPSSAAYEDGLGDYAGMNYRCNTSGPYGATTTLQSVYDVGPYDLTSRSKYYSRYSGVSGIHEADMTSFSTSAFTIADYMFDFTNFGLSYLSNEMDESRINGALDIPSPIEQVFDFEELEISCLGKLGELQIDGTGETDGFTWTWWDAPFTLHSAQFVADNECPAIPGPDECTFVVGFTGHASHLGDISGALGVSPFGEFITPADGKPASVPTRITLAGSLEFEGPAGQDNYTFNPTQGAYFSHSTSTAELGGVWSLFGTIDVAFFQDVETHLHTACQTVDPESAIQPALYLMGGWPSMGWEESGLDPFTASVFDQNNAAFTGADIDAYRSQSDEAYNARAQQMWLGMINFDYPLTWRDSTRDFIGFDANDVDLIALSVSNHLEYLSNAETSIAFGVTYDGLPTVDLTNFAFSQIEGATGFAQDWLLSGGDELFTVLDDGTDQFAALLDARIEELLGGTMDVVLDPWVDKLITAVETHYATGGTSATLSAAISARFSATATTPDSIAEALQDLADGVGAVNGVLDDIDERLNRIENAISVLTDPSINASEFVETVTDLTSGLLASVDTGGDVEREMMIQLALASIQVLSDVLTTTGAESEIEAAIDDAIAQIEPTLDSISATLNEVKDLISDLRDQISAGSDFALEVETLLTDLSGLSATFWTSVEAEATATLALPTVDIPHAGDFASEWRAEILQIVKDAYFAEEVVADVQVAIKQRLYDLDAAFEQAVDSAFAALNQAIRDALSPVLAGIDNSINTLVNNVNDKIGAGSIDGYAHITGDNLDLLRIDAEWEIGLDDPDNPLGLAAYLEIRSFDSDGPEGCAGPGGKAVEMEIGALDVGLDWLASDLRGDLAIKFAFDTSGTIPVVNGLGGSFELTDGGFKFETFSVDTFAATAMFGVTENYLGARVGLGFGSFDVEGGIFFGRSCTLEPVKTIDSLAADVLPGPGFHGIYCYGEGSFPVFGTGTCIFNVSAKAGAGVFYDGDSSTFGGIMTLGVYGEALCVVEVGGEVTLIGAKTGNNYAFAGRGKIFGKAGVCPLCVEFNKTVEFSYTGGKWDVDY